MVEAGRGCGHFHVTCIPSSSWISERGEACPKILSSARRISPDTIYIVCNQGHRFYVGASRQENGEQGRILPEPAPCNTAPAIALAAFSAREQGEPLLLVLPSDHILRMTTYLRTPYTKPARLRNRGASSRLASFLPDRKQDSVISCKGPP